MIDSKYYYYSSLNVTLTQYTDVCMHVHILAFVTLMFISSKKDNDRMHVGWEEMLLSLSDHVSLL